MNRWVWFGIQAFLGAVTLALLLYVADLGRVLDLIWRADPLYVAMAAATFVAASVMVGYSLFVLLERMGYVPPASKTIMVSIAGQLVSDLTPARTGYFVTPVLLGGELGVSFEDGMAAIVFTGAVQAFSTVLLGTVAIVYFSRFVGTSLQLIVFLAFGLVPVALMGLVLLSVIHHGWLAKLLNYVGDFPYIKPRIEQIRAAIAAFQKSGRRATGAALQVAFFLVVAQVINSLALFLLSLSVGITQLSILDFIMTYAIAGFSMYTFVTIAGIGVQESMYALLLGLMGVALDKATAVAILARFFFTATDLIGAPLLTRIGVKSIPGLLTGGPSASPQGQASGGS